MTFVTGITAADHFVTMDALDEMLDTAEICTETDWEEAFVADLQGRRRQDGLAMRMSQSQAAKLRQIAGFDD